MKIHLFRSKKSVCKSSLVKLVSSLFLVLTISLKSNCQNISYRPCGILAEALTGSQASLTLVSSTIGDLNNGFFDIVYRIPANYEGDIRIINRANAFTPFCISCVGYPTDFYNKLIKKTSNDNSSIEYTGPSQLVWAGSEIYDTGYIFYQPPSTECHPNEGQPQFETKSVPSPSGCFGVGCNGVYAPFAKIKAPKSTSTYSFFLTNSTVASNGTESVIVKRAKITFLIGDPVPPITTLHYHQLPKSRLFQDVKLLSKDVNFQICGDGSSASTFSITGGGLNYRNVKIRIKEDLLGRTSDIPQYGRFNDITRTNTQLVVRYQHPDSESSSLASRSLTIEILDNSNATVVATYPLKVYKAPVLMVHGLNSNADGFNKMEVVLSSNGWEKHILKRVNYESTSTQHFSDNKNIVPGGIEALFNQLMANGIAAGKVDIVGHSMGGLLTRGYLQSADYRDDIHRLITLNTPHSGSQFANACRDASINPVNALRNLFFVIAPFYLDYGALTDLAVDSDAIKSINKPESIIKNVLPVHSVSTTYPLSIKAPTQGKIILENLEIILIDIFFSIRLNELYKEATHDLIVSKTSQEGGLTGKNTSSFEPQVHMGSMENTKVIDKVVSLLNEPVSSDSYSKTGFKPKTITYTKVLSSPANQSARLGSIQVNSPSRSQQVRVGSTVQLQVTGSSIDSLWVVVSHSLDSAYFGFQKGDAANFSFSIDSTEGRRSVIAIGKLKDGTYISDTTHFFVSKTAPLNLVLSTTVEPVSIATIYPNPSNRSFTISTATPIQVQGIFLVDQLGRQKEMSYVRTSDLSYSIQTDDLPPGIYTLRIGAKTGFIVKKIQINGNQ